MKVGRPAPLGILAAWPWHLPSGMHYEQMAELGAPEHGRPTGLSPQIQKVNPLVAMP